VKLLLYPDFRNIIAFWKFPSLRPFFPSGKERRVDADEYESLMEWYWQGNGEVVGGNPVPVPLCPTQISHSLTRGRTRASAVKDRRLTSWLMARPLYS